MLFFLTISLLSAGTHPNPHRGQAIPVRLLPQTVLAQWLVFLAHDVEEMPGCGED